MCESKRRKNYISSHLCICKTYRLGQSIWGRLRSGRLGCQRLRCRWLKRENNYISFKSVKKKTYRLCPSRCRRLRCRRLRCWILGCQRLEMNYITSPFCIVKYVLVRSKYHHQPVPPFVLEYLKRNMMITW